MPTTHRQLELRLDVTDAAGLREEAHVCASIVLPEPLPAGEVTLEVVATDARTTIDRRFGEPVTLPVAISELSAGPRTDGPARIDTGCRDDLLSVDGQPVPIRISAAVSELLAGAAVHAAVCGDGRLALAAGDHELVTV